MPQRETSIVVRFSQAGSETHRVVCVREGGCEALEPDECERAIAERLRVSRLQVEHTTIARDRLFGAADCREHHRPIEYGLQVGGPQGNRGIVVRKRGIAVSEARVSHAAVEVDFRCPGRLGQGERQTLDGACAVA